MLGGPSPQYVGVSWEGDVKWIMKISLLAVFPI